jgi:hypothetical protein
LRGQQLTLAFAALLAACAPSRDVIPESHDVQAAASTSEAGYEYVARRPLAVIAVAESRGLPREVVTGVADRLANALDVCATRLAGERRLVPSAARVAAHIDRDGVPTSLALTLTPGPGPTANALLCFVSPFKLVRFPASDADPSTRGIAIEAAWGGSAIGMATPRPDAAP